MRYLRRWLLPLLTCLVVLSAALLPQRLSALRDEKLLGAAHTEELTVDNDLPLRPLDRMERVNLAARFEADPEACMASYRELQDDQELDTLRETILGELQKLTEGGGLPAELVPESFSNLETQRLYLRDLDSLTGASFLNVGGYEKQRNRSCWFIVDEESGRLLAMDLMMPAVRKYITSAEQLTEIGFSFIDRMGFSCEQMGASDREALFHLLDTDISYVAVVDDSLFSIRPCGYAAAAYDAEGSNSMNISGR